MNLDIDLIGTGVTVVLLVLVAMAADRVSKRRKREGR